ncbi:D-alanine transaminase [Sinobacterium caligoides]|uniref:Aminodeoxychorismate lyase n=1 Tax=Sinobacterium caligoides TaxID=933926 RepID=A0A3N2DXK6_9GAMM|nr:D-amino acid aminotransferase [Sinobacterium caligoides]ROS04586.1 D-alanine transaminase [Sinobacterium caligoides]
MSTVYLNGEYMPMHEAKISPMDRGFLFGDGIYEVVPCYSGGLVGFGPHMDRMNDGLKAIGIELAMSHEEWKAIALKLDGENDGENLGIYFHVSRGADTKRAHSFPSGVKPTVFAFAFEIPPAPVADKSKANSYSVSTSTDLRWKRCNIKSTALLGNVLHYQKGVDEGNQECILFDVDGFLTEGSSTNAYIVKDGVVITAPLSNALLPGITRFMLLDILRKDGRIKVEERAVSREEFDAADEVWLTSSSKEVGPVVAIDGKPVGNGEIGDVWVVAQQLFSEGKFNY